MRQNAGRIAQRQMQIIEGLSNADEHEINGRLLYREQKPVTLEWLVQLRPWVCKADLTFACLASPERAEKAVRRWLGLVAPGAWAIVGYERQERGAVHAHLLVDVQIDWGRGIRLWEPPHCGARIAAIRSGRQAMAYAVKHADKDGDFDVYGPGAHRGVFSTGEQLTFGLPGERMKSKAASHSGTRKQLPREGS
jgi:hypothetical protein